MGAWGGHLGRHSGHRTWPLTLTLLRGRFGPFWGSWRRFSSATWPTGGVGDGLLCTVSLGLTGEHIWAGGQKLLLPISVFVSWRPPPVLGQKLQVPNGQVLGGSFSSLRGKLGLHSQWLGG